MPRVVQEDSSTESEIMLPDIYNIYCHLILKFSLYYLYIDESQRSKQTGLRKTSWALLGTTPIFFYLYFQNKVLFFRISQGATDAVSSESFIERFYITEGRHPLFKSFFLVNMLFDCSERIGKIYFGKRCISKNGTRAQSAGGYLQNAELDIEINSGYYI
ncbi:hypothetical protein VI817_007183 [Penicillium citrinum]|nr:hypothetical protein VI817_007183 [Penicillium citrinum]